MKEDLTRIIRYYIWIFSFVIIFYDWFPLSFHEHLKLFYKNANEDLDLKEKARAFSKRNSYTRFSHCRLLFTIETKAEKRST